MALFDKDQFTSRMKRAKACLAELDERIAAQAADEDRHVHIHSAMTRLNELSGHLQLQPKKAHWASKR